MLGTLSILSDPVWSGLAWALLGGMLTSSFLTLFIIPILYYGDRITHKLTEDEQEDLDAPESPNFPPDQSPMLS